MYTGVDGMILLGLISRGVTSSIQWWRRYTIYAHITRALPSPVMVNIDEDFQFRRHPDFPSMESGKNRAIFLPLMSSMSVSVAPK